MQNFPCMHGLWYVIGQMIQDIHLKMTESTTCTLKHSILLGRFRDYSHLRHIAVLVHEWSSLYHLSSTQVPAI